MSFYQFCSTSQIRVGIREFNSIEELIESGYPKGLARKYVGDDFIFWWKDLKVMFPDKQSCSAAFVECTNTRITVGYPAFYFYYDLPSLKKALQVATLINKAWLGYEGDWREFLKSQIPRLEAELNF
jgi:hypothetical protein